MFSIVIPLFNKADCIINTLESVRRQHEQDFEVLIVDDGSTDGSDKKVLKWLSNLPISESIKYLLFKKENGGVSSARNYGVDKAKNDFVAFLDADDLWKENHLTNLRELINDFGSQVSVFSNASCQLIQNKIVLPKLSKFAAYRGICSFPKVSTISNGFLNSSSVCVSRNLISKVRFPVGWNNFEDVITWIKVTAEKGFAFNSERTVIYCIAFSEASKSINFDNYLMFQRELRKINLPYLAISNYLIRFLLIHFMYAKMIMPSKFFQEWRKVVAKSFLITICYFVVAVFPLALIHFLKDVRKDSQ